MISKNFHMFFVFCMIFLLIFGDVVCFQHRHFHTVASRNCPEGANSTPVVSIKSFDTKVFNFGQKIITETAYEIQQQIKDLKMTAQISRCNHTKNPDCEIYLEKVTISDMCDILEMQDTAWTIYLKTFDPPITKCPVEQGNYISRYASEKTDMIDLSAWFSDGLWRIQNILYSENQKVGCFVTDIEIYTPEHYTAK